MSPCPSEPTFTLPCSYTSHLHTQMLSLLLSQDGTEPDTKTNCISLATLAIFHSVCVCVCVCARVRVSACESAPLNVWGSATRTHTHYDLTGQYKVYHNYHLLTPVTQFLILMKNADPATTLVSLRVCSLNRHTYLLYPIPPLTK